MGRAVSSGTVDGAGAGELWAENAHLVRVAAAADSTLSGRRWARSECAVARCAIVAAIISVVDVCGWI